MFVFLNAFWVNFVPKEIVCPLFNIHVNMSLEITKAANTEEKIPIIRVVAKDSIGPEPKIFKTIAVNNVVTLASIIEERAFS